MNILRRELVNRLIFVFDRMRRDGNSDHFRTTFYYLKELKVLTPEEINMLKRYMYNRRD